MGDKASVVPTSAPLFPLIFRTMPGLFCVSGTHLSLCQEADANIRRARRSRSSAAIGSLIGIRGYSGARLVFPAVLRLISKRLPEQFPFHTNWRMDACHFAWWELAPTVDHILPVTRGGTDDDDSLVTTSQLRNSAKANFTLAELGWSLHPIDHIKDWDGLLLWFIEHLKRWFIASQTVSGVPPALTLRQAD